MKGKWIRDRRASSWALIFVVTGALAFASCSPSRLPTSTPIAADRVGGTIHVGLVHFWENYTRGEAPGPVFDLGLDPHVALGQQTELFRCCLVRTLLSYDGQATADGGTELQSDLATGLPEVSDDGLTWTFRLKQGLHYAPPLEDVEIVSADVVRAIERELTPTPEALAELPFSNPKIGAGWYIFEELIKGASAFSNGAASSIAGLETPDRYTLRVHATVATGDVPYLFALSDTAPIPPNPDDPLARLGAAAGHEGGYGPFLVASGPYMLEGAERLDFSVPAAEQAPAPGYRPGEGFTLVRNPSWERATDVLRPAYADRIEFTRAATEEAASAAVEGGSLDLAWDVTATPAEVASYSADQALRERLISEPNDVVFMILMNLAAKPLDDIHVRKALNLAVDKARIRELAAMLHPRFAGPTGGRVATHIVADGLEGDLLAGYRPYDAADDHGNLEAARAEMSKSAYDRDRDGICDAPECAGVSALVRGDEPFWAAIADEVSTEAAELGITFETRLVPAPEMFAAAFDPAAQLPIAFGIRWNKDYPTAAGVLPGLFSSSGLATNSSASLLGATREQLTDWGYEVEVVPSVDGRLEACQAELRNPVECWARLDQYLMEEVVPALPLVFGEADWIVSDRIAEASYAQSTGWPALDRFVVVRSAR